MDRPQFTDRQIIRLRVNAQAIEREVEVRRLLADFLREDLQMMVRCILCSKHFGTIMLCSAAFALQGS
jgi:hypothetical protein